MGIAITYALANLAVLRLFSISPIEWHGSSGMNIPPYSINEKNKQVVFHLKGGYSVSNEIPTWMKSFPDGYKGVTVRGKETF